MLISALPAFSIREQGCEFGDEAVVEGEDEAVGGLGDRDGVEVGSAAGVKRSVSGVALIRRLSAVAA
jgi:hypothetical protein